MIYPDFMPGTGYRTCLLLVVLIASAAGSAGGQEVSADRNSKASRVQVVKDLIVVGTRTYDESMSVEIVGGAKFIKGVNGKLVFKRLPNASRSQIFEGFAPGDVVFETACAEAGRVVFPEWWGATGNDKPASAKTNAVAINAALAAVGNSHLAVSLSGTYYINDRLLPRSGSTLTAEGNGAVKVVPAFSPPPDYHMIEVLGQQDVAIDGIEVDGNRTNQTQDAAHTYGGVFFKDSSRCIVKNCRVHDCNGPLTGGACGNGVRTHVATDITIADNVIHSNNGCGVNLYFSSKRIQVSGNTIRNNTEIGIESEGRNGTNYRDNRNSAITIRNNDIAGSTVPNRIADHSILIDWTDDAVVAANQCRASPHNGVEILGCHNVMIAENHCDRIGCNSPHAWAGIHVTAEAFGQDGRSSNVTICKNTIVGSQHGIRLDTADHISVVGNRITGWIRGDIDLGPATSHIKVEK